MPASSSDSKGVGLKEFLVVFGVCWFGATIFLGSHRSAPTAQAASVAAAASNPPPVAVSDAEPSPSDSVSAAYALCQVFDRTSIQSQPCSVDGWQSAVKVTINTSPSEASQMCPQAVAMARSKGLKWDDRWTLRIYSPYSGDNSIAYCSLSAG